MEGMEIPGQRSLRHVNEMKVFITFVTGIHVDFLGRHTQVNGNVLPDIRVRDQLIIKTCHIASVQGHMQATQCMLAGRAKKDQPNVNIGWPCEISY